MKVFQSKTQSVMQFSAKCNDSVSLYDSYLELTSSNERPLSGIEALRLDIGNTTIVYMLYMPQYLNLIEYSPEQICSCQDHRTVKVFLRDIIPGLRPFAFTGEIMLRCDTTVEFDNACWTFPKKSQQLLDRQVHSIPFRVKSGEPANFSLWSYYNTSKIRCHFSEPGRETVRVDPKLKSFKILMDGTMRDVPNYDCFSAQKLKKQHEYIIRIESEYDYDVVIFLEEGANVKMFTLPGKLQIHT